MLSLKRGLDAGGPICLEMPTGTGKTVSLLSLITSYQLQRPQTSKLVYCCRTVGEIAKTVEELRSVIAYRDRELGSAAPPTLAVTVSARKNLCIHPEVSQQISRDSVDAACRSMTASWQRDKARDGTRGVDLCDYYEKFERDGAGLNLRGIFSLEDLKEYGRENGVCPYFLARRAIAAANIVIYSYQYILHPSIAGRVSNNIGRESVIVFDEAHNIDDVCIEAFSIEIDKRDIDISSRNLMQLQQLTNKTKEEDSARLQEEYQRLLEGLNPALGDGSDSNAPPVLPQDVVTGAMPEEIRVADEFLSATRKFCDYVRSRLLIPMVTSSMPASFLQSVLEATQLDPSVLRFFHSRLHSLMETLQIVDTDRFISLNKLCDFATLMATYNNGFKIIIEPFDERTPHIPDPLLRFACLDAGLAMNPVLKRFPRIVITSGTLSPLNMIPRIMGFTPVLSRSLSTTLYRQNVFPLIVSRGSDQTMLSTKFEERNDMDIVRNYGYLLLRLAQIVPDGLVAFFVSYQYMEAIVSTWNSMGLINQLLKYKLVFVETSDILETSISLEHYKLACDSGRGGLFLSVARGKVSEGIDFANHYGRCVVLFGIPYVYTESRVLKARLEFLKENYQIREGDFLTFDAMRSAAQCLGRVIRGKQDYGAMVLADRRYARTDKRNKLPQWIEQYISMSDLSHSTESAVASLSNFFRTMSQPLDRHHQLGVALWSLDHVQQQPASSSHV